MRHCQYGVDSVIRTYHGTISRRAARRITRRRRLRLISSALGLRRWYR